VNLQQVPVYTTLSYVWGQNTGLVNTIPLVGDEAVQVTESLLTALAQFFQTNPTGFLWADQICIDQENIPERNQQVSLMGQIYGKAKSVSIWLGEGSYGTEIFMELVGALCSLPAAENTYKGRKEKIRTMIEVEATPSGSHEAHL
jgi:hypothetical protein